MAQPALTRYDLLLRIASRLGKLSIGSAEANATIHEAMGLTGPAPRYTTDQGAVWTLLPPDFEWLDITPTTDWIYAPCRRAGVDAEGLSYPHHGQWCHTIPLSMCASVLRAWAMLER